MSLALMSERGGSSSRRAASTGTDDSPAIMSTSSSWHSEDDMERRFSRDFSLSSRRTYSVERRCSGDGPDGPNQQDSCSNGSLSWSDNLQEMMCPPLPGQVPVGPRKTFIIMAASRVIESSTGTPTESRNRKRKRFRLFVQDMWKEVKGYFLCCCAVDVVEPFVPPAHLEPEPDPHHSGFRPSNESFESLFNVGEMLGSGGFGTVYEGRRKCDGKRVAIKQIHKIENCHYLDIPGHPEPLVTEVALLLLMRQEPVSPFVIQLYEWFEHPRQFTLIMEFPEPCESLLDFILRNPELDEATARLIMRQAVLAVQHCIEHGVFHNDVHLDNFLLKKNTLELKLIDFGCGQILGSDGYKSETYIGLPDYCPPEVFTDPEFHAVPTNVWALGVLLYEMVNGCSPFGNKMEITQEKVKFQNSNLSEGNNTLAALGGDLTRSQKSNPS